MKCPSVISNSHRGYLSANFLAKEISVPTTGRKLDHQVLRLRENCSEKEAQDQHQMSVKGQQHISSLICPFE